MRVSYCVKRCHDRQCIIRAVLFLVSDGVGAVRSEGADGLSGRGGSESDHDGLIQCVQLSGRGA